MVDPPTPKRRSFKINLTPDRFVVALVVAEALLFLSQRFRWFAFNQHKGWTVLIAAATVGAALLVMAFWWLVAWLSRRHFQFGIRSLLVLTVAVAIPSSWLSWEIRKAREQEKAVLAIFDLSGYVTYDWERDSAGNWSSEFPAFEWQRKLLSDDFFADPDDVELGGIRVSDAMNPKQIVDDHVKLVEGFTRVRNLDLSFTAVTDAGLERLKGLNSLEGLSLWGTDVTDAGLMHLRGLKRLIALELGGRQITDAGLEHLLGLPELQYLRIGSTRVTDAGLQELEALSQLRELNLSFTRVTDVGLRSLRGLSRLRILHLNETAISDAGLHHLEALVELEQCCIGSTRVTRAGANGLQRALPNCKVIYY